MSSDYCHQAILRHCWRRKIYGLMLRDLPIGGRPWAQPPFPAHHPAPLRELPQLGFLFYGAATVLLLAISLTEKSEAYPSIRPAALADSVAVRKVRCDRHATLSPWQYPAVLLHVIADTDLRKVIGRNEWKQLRQWARACCPVPTGAAYPWPAMGPGAARREAPADALAFQPGSFPNDPSARGAANHRSDTLKTLPGQAPKILHHLPGT